jgi:hypothetical protein
MGNGSLQACAGVGPKNRTRTLVVPKASHLGVLNTATFLNLLSEILGLDKPLRTEASASEAVTRWNGSRANGLELSSGVEASRMDASYGHESDPPSRWDVGTGAFTREGASALRERMHSAAKEAVAKRCAARKGILRPWNWLRWVSRLKRRVRVRSEAL